MKMQLSTLKNSLAALTLAVGALACAETGNQNGIETAQESVKAAIQRMFDFCESAPSDVDAITCTLRGDTELSLTATCWGAPDDGPAVTVDQIIAELGDNVAVLDLEKDCEIEAVQF